MSEPKTVKEIIEECGPAARDRWRAIHDATVAHDPHRDPEHAAARADAVVKTEYERGVLVPCGHERMQRDAVRLVGDLYRAHSRRTMVLPEDVLARASAIVREETS